MLPKVKFFLATVRWLNGLEPVYEEVGRVILKYHRALAQHTTVRTYKQETFEGIVLTAGLLPMYKNMPAWH